MVIVDVGVAALLLVGLVLVIRDTARRYGRWGINLKPVVCPRCGAGSMLRAPRTPSQALWGGRTCRCGCAMDKWGRELA